MCECLPAAWKSAIWDDCQHWLNLNGQWVDVSQLEYALTMQSLVPWRHFFDSFKRKTADFQRLGAEKCGQQPFNDLPTLASLVEYQFEEKLHGLPQPELKPWLQNLGQCVARIETEDEADQESIRQLGRQLVSTQWQVASGLETVPYIEGMRHRHTTPFEMCEIKLHVRVPMDCWRQWIRHRTANVNEYSTRYSEAINAAQATSNDAWREQAATNRQGSGQFLPVDAGEGLSIREKELHEFARTAYEERLTKGVAREQARKDLPLSTYTESYWKIDLHNLFHFLSLRMDAHAQLEIRSYANTIGNEIVAKWCPLAWEAFVDYRLNALFLTRLDKEIIQFMSSGNVEEATQLAEDNGWLSTGKKGLKSNRERQEFEAKLTELGFPIPWRSDESGDSQ